MTHNQGVKWIREPVMLIACAMNKPEPLTTYAGRYILMRYFLALFVILCFSTSYACQDRSPRNMVLTCPKCKKWTEEELLGNEIEYASAIALVRVTHTLSEIRKLKSGNEIEEPFSIAKVEKGWKGLVEHKIKLTEPEEPCVYTGFYSLKEGERVIVLFKQSLKKNVAYKGYPINDKSASILLKLLGEPKYVYVNGTPKENRI